MKKRMNRGRKGVGKVKTLKTWKLITYFVLFQVLFGIATAPILVYYGPFDNLKKNIVGEAMSTYSHQYLATMFLSTSQINSILHGGDVGVSADVKQDLSKINVGNHDSKIQIEKVQGRKFTGLMLIVHDPTRVKVGYSSKLGTVGEKTSEIAKENNAVAAINGGGFQDKGINSSATWTGTGAFPTGIIISKGKLIYPSPSNADTQQQMPGVVGITKDGKLVVGTYSIADLLDDNVTEALCFGPTLIENSEVKSGIDTQGSEPRTAIGQRADGSILLLTIDGRQGLQAGASIGDVQKIMKDQGAINAVNLDGGASTTMYYNGKVANNPSDKFGERPIPTIIYVKK
ncbi:MAG: phosphodiester glycosidase family protein [Clostridium sp.]|nr:phosphodiester glycosidase family protein [Clostridium sp.]